MDSSSLGRRLRIVEFNVENLFVRLDHYSGQDLARTSEKEWQQFSASTIPNKPLSHVRSLAKAILDLDADFLMLVEVGGLESLVNFNRMFLGDAYVPHLIEGNSDRGIDMGYLVKRNLPFQYQLLSHRHREIDFLYPHELQTKLTGFDHLPSAQITSHRFSRDVLEMRVSLPGASQPDLILLLVHLKSQLDRQRIDPGGRDRRRAEVEKLVKIYREIENEFAGQVPVLLGGDFNGFAGRNSESLSAPEPTDSEFNAIYRETGLIDALELANVPADQRYTYMQLSNQRPGRYRQLDYIFVPPLLQNRINNSETGVFRFLDELGKPAHIPRTLNEKRLLPSDHYPVFLTLNAVSENS